MRFRSAPPTSRHTARRNPHRVDDEFAVFDMADGVAAASWRPSADVRVFAAVHVDVSNTASLWRQDDLVFADDEVNRAGIRIDAQGTTAERSRRTRPRHDDV